jgi:hypothetical protein
VDAVTASLLASIGRLRTHGDPLRDGLFALVFGAVVGLLECKRLTESFSLVLPNDRLSSWEPQPLLDALDAFANDASRSFPWKNSRDSAAWSAGYFFNKAQSNTAAAIEYCIRGQLPEAKQKELALASRELVARLDDNQPMRAHVSTLSQAFDEYRNREVPTYLVQLTRERSLQEAKLASTHVFGPSITATWNSLANLDDGKAARLTFGWVNVWKHQPGMRRRRWDVGFTVEWALSAKAARWVGHCSTLL